MRVLNFGSMNVDYVYEVTRFVRPGETITAKSRGVFSGGKGLNQSIALARAGARVFHAGSIGADGDILLETLQSAGVNTDAVYRQDAPGGHTVIQVDSSGQNCIIVYGGTNRMVSKAHIDRVLSRFGEGDVLLLQNEMNDVGYIMEKASAAGMRVALNPSPCDEAVLNLPLDKVDFFVINEIEGAAISGAKTKEEIIPSLTKRYPGAKTVLTLGAEGSLYFDGKTLHRQDAFSVKAVDTTAAGDTYLGYFIYGLTQGWPAPQIMRVAAKAASIAVSRKGAADSIPPLSEAIEQL